MKRLTFKAKLVLLTIMMVVFFASLHVAALGMDARVAAGKQRIVSENTALKYEAITMGFSQRQAEFLVEQIRRGK